MQWEDIHSLNTGLMAVAAAAGAAMEAVAVMVVMVALAAVALADALAVTVDLKVVDAVTEDSVVVAGTVKGP